MGDDVVIRAEGLSKRYRIGRASEPYGSLRESLVRAVRAPFRKKSGEETIWALKNVSFDIKRGEVVGIIGRNGAGKSTLLKILTRITKPTAGEAVIRGRVGSLLEVGTGFHPELTGRENIYLNGAILGMHRHEIERKFDEMVDFAEIEKFLDTPVKHYSSGMYVRLAFAVAAHLEPEILLVDEVLAVGDAAFQKKCLGKMGEVAEGGRTVLFVSHNLGAVAKLCSQAIFFKDGVLVHIGNTDETIEKYLESIKGYFRILNTQHDTNARGKITGIRLIDESGQNSNTFLVGKEPVVEISYSLYSKVKGCHIACIVSSNESMHLFSTADTDTRPELFDERLPGDYTVKFSFPRNLLNVGQYELAISLGIPGLETLDRYEGVKLTLLDGGDFGSMKEGSRRRGAILVKLPWEYFE